jgi:ketosteroid isomerase-like protein
MNVNRPEAEAMDHDGAQPEAGEAVWELPASIEAAWGLRERPHKGPKPGLSLRRIVAAGVKVAESEGTGRFEPVSLQVHRTGDPEVVITEFRYEGSAGGRPVSIPNIFVTRVRDGMIIESRDYADHVAAAPRIRPPASPRRNARGRRTQIATPPQARTRVVPVKKCQNPIFGLPAS